jgi:nucleotide-binding universal stress UspA family protein
MYTFVAGIDTDESRATVQADAIAGMPLDPSAVSVVLIHAFGENPEGGTVEQVKSVRLVRDRLADLGMEVEARGHGGDPARALLRVAKEEDADQIVVAGRKRTPAGKAIFGSVTQSVVLEADRPVLVCGGDD